ncbi:MAG: hypothetical protein ACO1QR_03375 [Chthoniobacteraceae bacterium]
MSDNLPAISVELSTPRGKYLAWRCSAIELSSVDGSIEINPSAGNYLSLLKATRVTLRSRGVFYSYVLENATANLKDGCLIVLAEEIRQIEPAEDALPGIQLIP